jgi:hypothetical protein
MTDHMHPDDPGHGAEPPGDGWLPGHPDLPEPVPHVDPVDLGHGPEPDAPAADHDGQVESAPPAHDIQLPTDGPDGGHEYDGTALTDHLGLPWPQPADGCGGLDTVVAAAQAFVGVDAGDLTTVLHGLGLTDADLTFGIDGHTTALALGELGLDATAVHGDVDDLANRLESGQEVLVTGPDGGPLTLERIDLSGGTVGLVAVDGSRQDVPLHAFEERWEASSYAMVVADGPTSGGEDIALSTGPVTVLAMTWEPPDH